MKKVLIAVGVAALMILSYVAGRRQTTEPATAGASSRHVLYYVDPMHPSYHSDRPGVAPDCGMKLEPVYADELGRAPQSASAQLTAGTVGIDDATQKLMGIRVTAVEKTSAPRSIRLLGRVAPEDTRIYRMNAGSEGFIRETFSDAIGALVKKEQKLATVYGPEYLVVANGFLAAVQGVPGANGKDGARQVPHLGAVNKQGVSSIQGYTDRLRNLGMSEGQINEMAENHQLPETIDVRSPVEGFILDRKISAGQHFDRGMEFYSIADLAKVWILADVFGSDAHRFQPGTAARVSLRDEGKTFSARVTDVLPQVDPSSRTLKVRLEADNPGFALRPDMFVDVDLAAAMPSGLTVPVDAVIDSGKEQRVFVERSDGVFEARAVETGWHIGDRVEIVRGLSEGERIVAEGTFMVDSESRLKSTNQPAQPDAPKLVPRNITARPESGVSAAAADVKDPVCGMALDAKSSQSTHAANYRGETFHFCSDKCQRKFERDPAKYAGDKLGKATLPPHASGHAAND